MLIVEGMYDGKEIKLLEKIKIKKPMKVLVAFLEENAEAVDLAAERIRVMAQAGKAFAFLNDPAEDIYTVNDLKERYTVENENISANEEFPGFGSVPKLCDITDEDIEEAKKSITKNIEL